MRNSPIWINVTLIIGLVVILHGCQSSGIPTTPVAPTLHISVHSPSNSGNRHFLGFWDIEISSDHTSVTAVPLRTAEMHFNMVHILETKCVDCLVINNIQLLPTAPSQPT